MVYNIVVCGWSVSDDGVVCMLYMQVDGWVVFLVRQLRGMLVVCCMLHVQADVQSLVGWEFG